MHGSESRIAATPLTESDAPSAYFLQSHVFLARARRHWVILDVRRDKYLCVDRHQFESLGPWMQGWRETASALPAGASNPSSDAIALGDQLLSVGILSRTPHGTKAARPIDYALPEQQLATDVPAGVHTSIWPHATTALLSCIRATHSLRHRGFAGTIETVRARKRLGQPVTRSFDHERSRSLIAVFNELRLFYARPYVCLFDSLALINFLARYGLYPDWVFGVSADPFEAHCWVQARNVVLNDTLERVSAFTPIMCI
jgi:hypothetical protein